MSIPAQPVTPEAIAEARRLYEQTRVPMQRIADLLGISRSTLNQRILAWGWTRRRGRIPPDTVPAPTPAAAALVPAGTRRELIARLVGRIEGEIAKVERLLARAGLRPGADDASDAERAARTLGVLVRTLRELAVIERGAAPDTDEEDAARDPDAFRRELAATLDRVLAGRAAE